MVSAFGAATSAAGFTSTAFASVDGTTLECESLQAEHMATRIAAKANAYVAGMNIIL